MFKVGVCGHFGGNRIFLDGQTIKTKIITNELRAIFGNDQIHTVDTFGGKKKLLHHICALIAMHNRCENIVILPAQNSLFVFAPLLVLLNKFNRRKIHYVVIGGWLPEIVKKRKILKKCLALFDNIFVETSTMKSALEEQNLNNITVLRNCKNLSVLEENELVFQEEWPLKLCTFSRVTEKKGIDDIVEAIKSINTQEGKIIFTLEIYGQIDTEYKQHFKNLLKEVSKYISYKGVVEFDKSVEVLKNYYALVFPTLYYTEGIPGTIIDAYAAGVPVISAKWESFDDVVKNQVVGLGYEFGNRESLKQTLMIAAKNTDLLNKMKINCINEAKKYTPKLALKILVDKIQRG